METSYVYIFVLIYWVRSRRNFSEYSKCKNQKINFSRKDRMRIIYAFWFFTGWDFWFEKFPCGLLNSRAKSHFRFWADQVKKWLSPESFVKKILLRSGLLNDDKKNLFKKVFFSIDFVDSLVSTWNLRSP